MDKITLITKDKVRLSQYDNYLLVPFRSREIAEKVLFLQDEHTLDIEFKRHREKRSLDANAYAWVLLQKIAEVVKSTKDEIYLQMIRRYGQCEYVIAVPEKAQRIMDEFRYAEEVGEVLVNGKSGTQLRLYLGSSSYDTKEMADFIDGIISECEELEIETKTPEELAKMKKEWGV